jgi:hypothetical protein
VFLISWILFLNQPPCDYLTRETGLGPENTLLQISHCFSNSSLEDCNTSSVAKRYLSPLWSFCNVCIHKRLTVSCCCRVTNYFFTAVSIIWRNRKLLDVPLSQLFDKNSSLPLNFFSYFIHHTAVLHDLLLCIQSSCVFLWWQSYFSYKKIYCTSRDSWCLIEEL